MMDYLPLSFDIKNKPVLLVGAGSIALRKARMLLKAQANIKVVSIEISETFQTTFQNEIASGQIKLHKRPLDNKDLEGCILAVAATNQQSVNEQVSYAAQKLNLPVNVVDKPNLSTIIFPSIVDRNPISIAISTGGHAPVLARLLRARIETLIPRFYGDLASLVDKYRPRVKELLPDIDQRKAFWEKVLQGSISEHMLSNRVKLAERGVQKLLEAFASGDTDKIYDGEVYLVGAGPGDVDLLSFKALRLLQQADVVLYDRLVSQDIVDLARKDAELIYVGKKSTHHTVAQEGINALLVKLAQEGKRVCRLKGGDPFIFGRGGEEIETLSDAGISFQVVPGITAASGCASYAGIPLTHRDYSQSVLFVTGHRKKDPSHELNWKRMAEGDQTLVFYMGLSELENISQNLIDAGLSSSTPSVVIQQGTTKNQRVVEAALSDLPQKAKNAELIAPTLIIIGQVISLRSKLDWFSTQN